MQVIKTYSGRIGCMCGCKGKYSYTAEGAEKFGPGYDVDVNERSVKLITARVLKDPRVQWEDNIAYVEDRNTNRIRVVFFKEQA